MPPNDLNEIYQILGQLQAGSEAVEKKLDTLLTVGASHEPRITKLETVMKLSLTLVGAAWAALLALFT